MIQVAKLLKMQFAIINLSLYCYYSIDAQTKNPTFAVGLQGIDESDVDKVIGIIEETFHNVIL